MYTLFRVYQILTVEYAISVSCMWASLNYVWVSAYCRPSLGLGNTAGAEILEGDVWRALKSVPPVAAP